MAPPLAGKGTQGVMLAESLNIPHISVGAILRRRADFDDAAGKILDTIMSQGKLVDTRTTIKLIENELHRQDIDNGFILDGFPRSHDQAIAYRELMQKMRIPSIIVIHIGLSYEQAEERIKSRFTCLGCDATYSIVEPSMRPKQDGICDNCDEQLVQRSDDNLDALAKRFELFEKETMPVLAYFERIGMPVINVNGYQSRDEIFNELIRGLNEVKS